MGNNVLLRRMTYKSVIDKGKYKGYTVEEVLKISKIHLLRLYFGYDNLTFVDEILDQLNLRDEDRITKPGKATKRIEYYLNRNLFIQAKIDLDKKGIEDPKRIKTVASSILKTKEKKYKLSKLKEFKQKDKVQFSKGSLQRRNQGHK
jgi:hypothetical protein